MSDNRKSFVFYGDWRESIKDLPNDIRLDIYDGITEYAITGNIPELKPLAKIAFSFIKTTIDRDRDKYQSIVDRNKQNGSVGGRPKKTKDNPKNPVGILETKDNPKNPVGILETKDNPKNLDSGSDNVSDSDLDVDSNESTIPPKSNNTPVKEKTREKKISTKNSNETEDDPKNPFWGNFVENSPYGDGRLHKLCGEYNRKNPGKYPPEFYKEFLTYWTAPILKGANKGQELWRKNETWSLGGRLNTAWQITGKNYSENGKTRKTNENYLSETLRELDDLFAVHRSQYLAEHAATDGSDTSDDAVTGAVVAE